MITWCWQNQRWSCWLCFGNRPTSWAMRKRAQHQEKRWRKERKWAVWWQAYTSILGGTEGAWDLWVLKEKEMAGNSRRKQSKALCPDEDKRMLSWVPSPISKECPWWQHWEHESKEMEVILHRVAVPILGRDVLHGTGSFLRCWTPQRVFGVTNRAKAWQRQCNDWDGVGKVTALSGWAGTFHTVAVVSHLQGGPHSWAPYKLGGRAPAIACLLGCEAILPQGCTTSSVHKRGVAA